MHHWLADQLDRQHIAAMRTANANPRPVKPRTLEEKTIANARRRRDPEPIRRLYPHIADFIFPPKGRQGRPKERSKDQNTYFASLKIAYGFAVRIRKLWQKQYGQQNRPRDDHKISAEAFAAAICNEWFGCSLTTDDVLNYKPSGKHTQPRRKKIPRQLGV
jgi:hypothetical protein